MATVAGTVVGIRTGATKAGREFAVIEVLQAGNGTGKPSEVVAVRTLDVLVTKKYEIGKPATLSVVIAERDFEGRKFLTCDLAA